METHAFSSEDRPVVVAKRWMGIAALGLVFLLLIIGHGMYTRHHSEAVLARETEANAILRVRTIHPALGSPSQELVLPANVEAYNDTPIYARTSGYLKHWHVDIGAHVKSGQLLAEIESPEVDQQLRQARAMLANAQADAKLARSTDERWKTLRKTDSVSPQDADEKAGEMESKLAGEEAARANVNRLEQLQSFEKIYAPFSGVITARNVDIGDLITEGSSGTARELFHLAAEDQVRVYFQVPQVNASSATAGAEVTLSRPEVPGKLISARITRTAEAIDPQMRTLRAEVDLSNKERSFVPGAYVQVHLKLPTPANVLIVPINGVLFRSEGISVAVVRGDHVELQPVSVGRDFGNSLEITNGLSVSDQIVINPPDSLLAGQKVWQVEGGAL